MHRVIAVRDFDPSSIASTAFEESIIRFAASGSKMPHIAELDGCCPSR
jgi:hypothetical protein